MLFILMTLYLFQGLINVDAAPLFDILHRQTSTDPTTPQECVCPDTRSRWDIIQSCLATIFACTWVSVHPNIPALGEPWWKRVLQRLELMLLSMMAPELIIYSAAKEWAAARHLAEIYKEHGWTMRHGYFLQMGGFMLYDNDKPNGVLNPYQLDRLLKEGRVVMPPTTDEEIQDRSKSDGLSKALVVIQTTWFIYQCIARRVQGLIITELELVTLAFAALNGVMYMFWWFKPLDVQTTVRIDLLVSKCEKLPVFVQADAIDRSGISQISQELQFSRLEHTPGPASSNKIGLDDATSDLVETEIGHENLTLSPYQSIKSSKFQDLCSLVWWLVSGILFRWPGTATEAVIKRRNKFIFNSNTVEKGAESIPRFYFSYTYYPKEPWVGRIVIICPPLVGILFGAIHCAGWNLSFPSLIEANIWRVSSAIITTVPVTFLLLVIYAGLRTRFGDHFLVPKSLKNNFLVQRILNLLERCLKIALSGLVLCYIIARLALLVVALIALRDLPQEALTALKWTSFLPHI